MPRTHRLSRTDFPNSRGARRFAGLFFSLAVSTLPAPPTRFACVVSKKVAAKAHERNRIKRHCKEAARPLLPSFAVPRALVFTAKKQAAAATFRDIRADVEKLLESVQ